jgi:hypothetical protein
MGLDLTAPAPPIVGKPKYLGGRSFQLSWKRTGKETDFAGWMVTRSRQVGGPYTNITATLLPAAQTSFIDTGAYAHGQTYYIIAAVDTVGNMGVSMAAMALTPDTIPPGRPTGLKGRIDRKGRVFLSWNRNTEEDMKGYKVYYANGPDHPYSQISSAPDADTVFVDSIGLKTLTKYVWYEIVAVDLNNNHSKYSAPLQLKRPDIVPPAPPVAAGVLVDSAGAHIRWIRSYSDDVVSYILFRRQGDTIWRPVVRMLQDTLKKEIRFTDSTMKPFTTYQYCAEAVDEDSLHSIKSVAITAAVNTAPPMPAPRTLTATYDGRSGQVDLKWQFKGQGSYYFILYRGMGGGALSRFHTASQNTAAYADTPPAPLPAGSQVRYAIQVLFKDGQGKTRVSDAVAVTIP